MTIETNSAITPTGLLGKTALTVGTVTPAALRTLMADQYKGADIASAATTNLATATGDFVDVTGTTTITAFGTADAGIERTVRFTSALILTYNATSLILPTAANITTTAGDVARFRSLGSGNWVCIGYQRASGLSLVPGYPVPGAELTADGTDASTDAFALKICNASSVITRTLPSSLPTIGSYIEYYNRSAYPVKISAGTDGIGTAGFDYVYLLQGNRLRLTYVSASDPKWICDGWQTQVAVVNAASADWVTTNSTTLADVTNFNWRLGLSGDAWFFEIDAVYLWVDGIHLKVRLDQEKLCLLVMLGVRADGRKELVAITDGYRSWWSYVPHFIATPGYVYAYAYGQLLAARAAWSSPPPAVRLGRDRGRRRVRRDPRCPGGRPDLASRTAAGR